MIAEEYLTLRATAEALDLESWRLSRLGRYLHIMSGTPCIPRTVVARARAESDWEQRYQVVLDWLLANVHGDSRRGTGTAYEA